MKGRVIVLRGLGEGQPMAALIEDGRLTDLLVDPPAVHGPGVEVRPAPILRPGSMYRAKVDRVVPKMGGAFVRLPDDHQGFLRDAKGVRAGEAVVVQVVSLPEPGKAAPVTSRLLYKGRRVIYTPNAPGINLSRQIKAPEERARLAGLAEDIVAADDLMSKLSGGWILRTAAQGVEDFNLRTEMRAVADTVPHDPKVASGSGGRPGHNLTADWIALLDWTWPLPDRIAASRHHCSFLANYANDEYLAEPALNEALEDHVDTDPFDHYGVWDEIERLRTPRVELPSGAWMSVEPTRAMVTVDVNTGENFNPAAGLTANIEAARELPRQLRLRGLGGQIAVDFAPLRKMDRKRVEEALKAAFRKDPVETSLAGWTPLGNFELQRKRERRPLAEVLG